MWHSVGFCQSIDHSANHREQDYYGLSDICPSWGGPA